VRCSRARELLTLYLLNELDPAARAEVDEHLAECPACRAELPAAKALIDLLNGALASVPAGERLAAGVMAQVAEHPLPQRVRPEDVPEVPVAEDVIDRLSRIPDFVRAYDPQGMKPNDFISYAVTQRTLTQFCESGWYRLEKFGK
jgi:hypothetical protein